ncbi:hypothetical protein F5888DRAFT_1804280 [Russula emetica]|nr:hypothetical protein F5888DRAFT_1804280 [Russula emetica]
MVNFHDPIVIAREYGEVYRFWGLMDGIFIWEFMITLDYEWSVIRGRRPYRWTIWIYSLIRVATLATVALNIFSLDATTRINCQVCHAIRLRPYARFLIAWFLKVAANLQFIFAYLALATSSLLIVLRIIAIWDRKKVIVAFATGVWGINVAFLIQGKFLPPSVWGDREPYSNGLWYQFRSSWEVDNVIDGSGCVFYLDSIRLSTVVAFAADIILLLIMLFGRPVAPFANYRTSTLDSPVYFIRKGVVWFLLAVVTELTPTPYIFFAIIDDK